MTAQELADHMMNGSASLSDVLKAADGESRWLAGIAELENRCVAAGKPLPDRSSDYCDPRPLVAALTGQAVSTPATEDVSGINYRLRNELATARRERDRATSDLERERAAHKATQAELATLKADVESNAELTSARAEVTRLQGVIETMKRDHEAALKSLDYDVDQRAAAKIVAIGIREPKPADAAAYNAKTESVTDACRRAAAAQSKTH
jgi:hypothetical protein